MAMLNDKGRPSGNLGEQGNCVGRYFEHCDNTRYCAGKQSTVMVYRIADNVGEYCIKFKLLTLVPYQKVMYRRTFNNQGIPGCL